MTGRPRRRVHTTSIGYVIHSEPFTTTDKVLAKHVAAELDRVDPLPYDHTAADLIEISTLAEPPGSCYLWTCCGEVVRP